MSIVEYGDEGLLMLSGIQHICFCERQWALIHIESQWADNRLTVEGEYLHRKVDEPLLMERRKEVVVLRSVSIVSRVLGLYGISDVVEMHLSDGSNNSIQHPKYHGWWTLIPVEYKRGRRKEDDCDAVQLCAQGICLEEMYGVQIEYGFLYYGEERRRVEIAFTSELRKEVSDLAEKMHSLFEKGETPMAILSKRCVACSLRNLCMPELSIRSRFVHEYLLQLEKE